MNEYKQAHINKLCTQVLTIVAYTIGKYGRANLNEHKLDKLISKTLDDIMISKKEKPAIKKYIQQVLIAPFFNEDDYQVIDGCADNIID